MAESEEAKDIIFRYEKLIRSLEDFEKSVFDEWTEKVPDQIVTNLKKSLIIRNEQTRCLSLNFSGQLFSILKEVHNLKLMNKEGIPEIAIEFSSKSETYRSYTLSLEKTIDFYNQILTQRPPCELELILAEIKEIDVLLETGISELTWNSEGIESILLIPSTLSALAFYFKLTSCRHHGVLEEAAHAHRVSPGEDAEGGDKLSGDAGGSRCLGSVASV